jgi:hypothetical protein
MDKICLESIYKTPQKEEIKIDFQRKIRLLAKAIIKLEPTEESSSVKYWFKLAPIETLVITAVTLIMIPSIVRADRSFEIPILLVAILKTCSDCIIIFYSPAKVTLLLD